MRDYLKELMETWTSHGEQAAFSGSAYCYTISAMT